MKIEKLDNRSWPRDYLNNKLNEIIDAINEQDERIEALENRHCHSSSIGYTGAPVFDPKEPEADKQPAEQPTVQAVDQAAECIPAKQEPKQQEEEGLSAEQEEIRDTIEALQKSMDNHTVYLPEEQQEAGCKHDWKSYHHPESHFRKCRLCGKRETIELKSKSLQPEEPKAKEVSSLERVMSLEEKLTRQNSILRDLREKNVKLRFFQEERNRIFDETLGEYGKDYEAVRTSYTALSDLTLGYTQRNNELIAENTERVKAHNEIFDELQKAEAENAALTTLLDNAKTTRDGWERMADQRAQENAELSNELIAKKAEILEYHNRLAEMQGRIDKAIDQLKQYEEVEFGIGAQMKYCIDNKDRKLDPLFVWGLFKSCLAPLTDNTEEA